MFAYAARDHSKHYGTTVDQYAKITYKNRRHGAMNNRACFQVCPSVLCIKSHALVLCITACTYIHARIYYMCIF